MSIPSVLVMVEMITINAVFSRVSQNHVLTLVLTLCLLNLNQQESAGNSFSCTHVEAASAREVCEGVFLLTLEQKVFSEDTCCPEAPHCFPIYLP